MSAVQVQEPQAIHVKANAKTDSVGLQLVVSGVSVATATLCTNPLDVIKVRMQLRKLGVSAAAAAAATSTASSPSSIGASKPLGVIGTGSEIIRQEGVAALWKGVKPSMARGLVYGGLRLGLYSPCRDALSTLHISLNASSSSPSGSPAHAPPSPTANLGLKAAAGALSGGLAAALTSPTELVKTRQQAHASGSKPAFEIIRDVVRAGGVTALWRGATPGVIRASLLTSSQCATYDEIKRFLIKTTPMEDGTPLHILVSSITGLVTTTATTPADVVKTLMFSGKEQYRTVFGAAKSLFNESGSMGFFRGWLPNYLRLGPQTIITFVVAERLREMAGLSRL